MIIEFIGAPGAGKTTLVPAAVNALQAKGYKAFTTVDAARPFARRTLIGSLVDRLAPLKWQRPLLWQVFYWSSALRRVTFFAKHPKLFQNVLGSQWRRPAEANARERRVLTWYFRQAGYYDFLEAHCQPDEALIFDEGFVHRVVQLFASPVEDPDRAVIQEYISLLPVPDLVIGIQAPFELCEQRIYSRGLWERFEGKSEDEVSRFVASAHRAVTLTLETMQELGWPLLKIDNSSDDPARADAQLSREVAQFQFTTPIAPALQAVP